MTCAACVEKHMDRAAIFAMDEDTISSDAERVLAHEEGGDAVTTPYPRYLLRALGYYREHSHRYPDRLSWACGCISIWEDTAPEPLRLLAYELRLDLAICPRPEGITRIRELIQKSIQ